MEILIFLGCVVVAAWFVSQVIFKPIFRARSRGNNSFISNYIEEKPEEIFEVTEDHKEEQPVAVFSVTEDRANDPPDFQPLLTKAVEYKQAKRWNKALSCLDQAYQLAAAFPAEYCEGAYLRLPYYFQLAGRNNEAWLWLNYFSNGLIPHRGVEPCGLEQNIYWRLKVEDKKRLFLEKENKFSEALRCRCTNLYLTAVTQFMLAMESPEFESRAIPFGIPGLTEKLTKPVEKAKLKPDAAEILATIIFSTASKISNNTHALAEVADLISQISDAIKLSIDNEITEKNPPESHPLKTEEIKQVKDSKKSTLSNQDKKASKPASKPLKTKLKTKSKPKLTESNQVKSSRKIAVSSQDKKSSKPVSQQQKTKDIEKKISKELNESTLSNRNKKILRSAPGTYFNWEGVGTGWNPGEPQPVPRWFVDLRDDGKIRVNVQDDATVYLRDDGYLFSVNKQWWPSRPLECANIQDTEKFWDNVYKAENARINHEEIWEICEYVPDPDCTERKNIWRVAVGCRRSGRFFYTAKRKTAKQYLEGPDENIHWIYSEVFDQFTEAYEERYQKRVKETMKRNRDAEEYRRKHAKTFKFNFNFNDFISEKPIVDHYAVLGVDKKSGPREVKKAYWSLARQYHPDLNPNDSVAEEKFKCISVSYQELMKQFGN